MREHEHESINHREQFLLPKPEDGPALRWLKVHARYIRTQLGERALIAVRLSDGAKFSVEQILALQGDSVVLKGRLENGSELHYSTSASGLSLEIRAAPEGKACTSLGYLSVSATPQQLIEPTTKPAMAPDPEQPPEPHARAHRERRR